MYYHHDVSFSGPFLFGCAGSSFKTTRVTKIGLIDLDEPIEGHASKNTWKTTSIKFTPKREFLPFAAFALRSYPPPDALMETRDSRQVVQPVAEKGGLFVIPWRGRVRFHET